MANLSSAPLTRSTLGGLFDHLRVGAERARVLRVADDVRRIVARYADVDPLAVVATFELEPLRRDAPAFDDVVLALEARFDLDIDIDEAATWTTVADIVAHVSAELRENPLPV
jgi:acyl carrier protein